MTETPRYNLRAAVLGDWPFIQELYSLAHVALWTLPPTSAGFSRTIDEPGTINQIIEFEGQPFGNILMTLGPAWLLQLHLLAVKQPRRGAGRFALREAIEFGFDTLKVHRIFLEIVEANDASRRLCESLGFRAEGLYRDGYHSEHAGFQNLVPYGLLASDRACGN